MQHVIQDRGKRLPKMLERLEKGEFFSQGQTSYMWYVYCRDYTVPGSQRSVSDCLGLKGCMACR